MVAFERGKGDRLLPRDYTASAKEYLIAGPFLRQFIIRARCCVVFQSFAKALLLQATKEDIGDQSISTYLFSYEVYWYIYILISSFSISITALTYLFSYFEVYIDSKVFDFDHCIDTFIFIYIYIYIDIKVFDFDHCTIIAVARNVAQFDGDAKFNLELGRFGAETCAIRKYDTLQKQNRKTSAAAERL